MASLSFLVGERCNSLHRRLPQAGVPRTPRGRYVVRDFQFRAIFMQREGIEINENEKGE